MTDFDVCGMITSVDNHETFNQDTLKTLNLYDNVNGFNNAAGILADKNHFPGIDIVKFGENIGWKLPQVQIFPEFPTGAAFLNDSIY